LLTPGARLFPARCGLKVTTACIDGLRLRIIPFCGGPHHRDGDFRVAYRTRFFPDSSQDNHCVSLVLLTPPMHPLQTGRFHVRIRLCDPRNSPRKTALHHRCYSGVNPPRHQLTRHKYNSSQCSVPLFSPILVNTGGADFLTPPPVHCQAPGISASP